MTVAQFLTSGYLWGPVALVVVLLLILSRIESREASRLNHPAAKWQQHDNHFKKKNGIPS